MRLPVPNEEEVKTFQSLCKEKFGVKLSLNDAQHYATKIVQLFYVRNYCIHPLCPPGEREGSQKPGPIDVADV